MFADKKDRMAVNKSQEKTLPTATREMMVSLTA